MSGEGRRGKRVLGWGKDFIFCVPQCKPDRAFEGVIRGKGGKRERIRLGRSGPFQDWYMVSQLRTYWLERWC